MARINVGSEASEAPLPLQGMYSASKHAVKGFTDALRIELEADGAPVSITLIQPTAVDTPYPEHAGNYLTQEPKLPTPMFAPEKVATAILNAATDPVRNVKVGAMAVLDTTMAVLMPALASKMASLQMGRQQRHEAPHAREGTLYRPGECERVHGRGDQNAADMDEARQSNLRSA
jgi:short-subunit dehydrogenase